MALSIVRADGGVLLADALAERLRVPPSDPLAAEEVVVHSRGMERWLSQHLSRHLGTSAGGDGISANVAFPFPADVVRRAVSAVGGPDPHRSAWRPDRSVWHLLDLVEGGLGDWATPLTARLAADPDGRFEVLRGVADRFDAYAVHRPDMVLRWLDGMDVTPGGGPLDAPDRWQPELLRRLHAHVGQPTVAESARDAVDLLRSGSGPLAGLPERLTLFGFTALPAAHLAVLVAMATRIDVGLLLLHPSPGLWARWEGLAGSLDDDGLPVLPARGALDAPRVRNRLLASWGRDAAEMQVVVQTIAPGADATALQGADPPDTVLGRLQAQVRRDAAPPGDPLPPDGSVQLHACTGRARQVQVLRDEVLRLLADDPTLRPRDVVVMCPDVEQFAPLVNAHLAVPAEDPDGRPDLRVRLADRSLRQLNPMLRAVDDVLGLALGRVTAARLVDLCASEPVRRRFGFTADDLESLERLVAESGMRWGLDEDDRARDGVQEMANSIRSGLSRLLLGVAMADEDLRTLDGVTPHDDVEGGATLLVGRLAELCDRLAAAIRAMRTPMPLDRWVEVLTDVGHGLLREPADQPWQRTELAMVLESVREDADGSTTPVSVAEVRALLGDRLRGQPSWANHRTGDLTVCTLVPMRSVPHRVVCLLGMDDEVFPRDSRPTGDDLLARHPRVGDRDPRTEDRQLLLDAVMAAADVVLITYSGTDERTGEPRPPCVPVAELARALDAQVRGGAAALTTEHPLNAHDPAAFEPARPGFDPQAHAAARVVAAGAVATPSPTWPVEVGPPAVVDVDDLVRFARDPAAWFYRRTVRAWVPDTPEESEELVPLTVSGLTEWALGQALLDHGGVDDERVAEQVVATLRGRGELPPEPHAARKVDRVLRNAGDIAGLCRRLGLDVGTAERQEVRAVVGDRTVVGTVRGIRGDRHVCVTYSKLKAKQMVDAWVRLLVLTAADPSRPWEAAVVGRHETEKRNYQPRPHAVRFHVLGADAQSRADTATALLGDLLALHDDGLREPLVAPAATAAAYAIRRIFHRDDPDGADGIAADRWDPRDRSFDVEAANPGHVLRHGDVLAYDDLRAQPPRPADAPRDGRDPEPHHLAAVAMRLWAPLLAHCREWSP